MASSRKFRKKWLRWHAQYERFANRELTRVFKTWAHSIPYERLTEDNYKKLIDRTLNVNLLKEAYYNLYSRIGRTHGERIGKEINRELKEFEFFTFFDIYIKNIVAILNDYGFLRIKTVRNQYRDSIIDLLAMRLDNDVTVRDASKQIEKIVKQRGFYRWKALRIARTETTAASNEATYVAGKTSGYKMEKVWISANDKRTRRKPPDDFDHFEMNDVRIGYDDYFVFNKGTKDEDRLLYPGDINGQAGNVINCRCAIAVVPKRDKDGFLISTD